MNHSSRSCPPPPPFPPTSPGLAFRSSSSEMRLKTCSNTRGMRPRTSKPGFPSLTCRCRPCIVNVFPAPVCP